MRSEITAEGKRITKLDQILLNGNNVALVRETVPTMSAARAHSARPLPLLQLVPGGDPSQA